MTSSAPHDDVLTRIRKTISTTLGLSLDQVADDADLASALGDRYDSLSALEVLTAVEQEFGVEVDFVADDVRYWFATSDRMSRFVEGRLEDAAALGGRA